MCTFLIDIYIIQIKISLQTFILFSLNTLACLYWEHIKLLYILFF